ncbi:pyridoxal phosphate-dependent transferase [Halteromyces radiatus]|uniref:pyridoxal phosphate-dependent transferase n=1 Tax=Halteromyces radiatus TaxID=101107 RepID=UPI00221E7F6E|nr:pyridoxal phosphate-dependent transferase [Halteromyces radiatus]KAI8089746.1 pyridoxal phosphate-dependent transferase [Halteromyces radiatus]
MTVKEYKAHPGEKVLTINSMNNYIKKVEYAVRGRIAIRAEEIRDELSAGKKFPFDTVVNCNIGNPQQLNQKPITFFRQVASLCENPDLLSDDKAHLVSQLYPSDAITRAKQLLKDIGPSIGAYSHSQGVPAIRRTVANFLEKRDNSSPANINHIYLTQGASSGVQTILTMLTQDSHSGIMIPIPQYPLYSATLSLVGATPVPYYLDERQQWGLDIEQLTRIVKEARHNGTDVRALVIINPGNPTGQCLTKENLTEILTFCYNQQLVLLADEVYQTNIYTKERPFISFRKALLDHPLEHVKKQVELVSFHSISKGMVGECGRRGGYFECINLNQDILDQIYKMASVSLCPNIHGQILVDLMCHPPQPNDPSYPLYREEYEAIYQSLKRRSQRLEDAFNAMEGVSCQPAQGSMYLFPTITLPKKAIQEAQRRGLAPDAFYSEEMLEATGVCVVPGSGFGQVEGTYHFRSTFLPEEHLFDAFCSNIEAFHAKFLNQYKD